MYRMNLTGLPATRLFAGRLSQRHCNRRAIQKKHNPNSHRKRVDRHHRPIDEFITIEWNSRTSFRAVVRSRASNLMNG